MNQIYVIHCSELPERTDKCREHLKERGLFARFWRSYHGNTWGIETTKEYDPGKRISPGHVGLNMGTWALWQHLTLTPVDDLFGEETFIIFEDDVEVPGGFDGIVADLQVQLRYDFPDWDLVFLGLAETEPHVWNKVTERIGSKPNSKLCRMNDPFGTHAYMVRRRALPVLLDNMTVAQRNLDQQLWERVLKKGLLKWCAVLPSIVRQRTFDYVGAGKPEWKPSTIDPNAGRDVAKMPQLAADEQDVKRMCGATDIPGRPSPEAIAATSALVDPYPCIYRGEPMEDHGTAMIGGKLKTVPLNQCARLNVSCHSKEGIRVITVDKELARSCETCDIRTGMMATGIRPRLPLPEGHFNPSMLMYNGRAVLATRDSWGHSKLALWELKNEKSDWSGRWSVTPIGSFATDHKDAPRLEDPRLFLAPNPATDELALHAMLNLPDGYPPKRVQVGYVRFDRDLTKIEYTTVFLSPNNNLYEKNWSPFHDGKELNWIYATKPEHIVIGESKTYRSHNFMPWSGGVIRGGATPVQIGEVYYHFFHGCLKRFQGSVYTVGCAVFEAEPPFRVLRQTPVPLIWPDLPGADENVVKRYVMWPGGAIPHDGHWHLALGIDDTNCRIVRLPFEVVESALKNVPELSTGTTIRDTPLARGIKASEV